MSTNPPLKNRVKCPHCAFTTPRFHGPGNHVGYRRLRNHILANHWEEAQQLYHTLRQDEMTELPDDDLEDYNFGF